MFEQIVDEHLGRMVINAAALCFHVPSAAVSGDANM
jgi:hypothetical protein